MVDNSSPTGMSSNAETPRRAEWILFAALLLCILEGAVRKWILRDTESSLKYLPYFGKDIALVGLVLLCRPRTPYVTLATFRPFLQVGLGFVIVGGAFSASAGWSLVGSILSFRSLILLPLLAYFAISRLYGLRIERVALLLAAFTCINAVLGTFQRSSPADSPINYYASDQLKEAVAYEGNVRAVGTFSYITGFADFAVVGAWAGLVLLSRPGSKKLHFLGWISYAAAVWCALLSISRSATIIVLLLFIVWLVTGDHPLVNLAYASFVGAILISAGSVLSVNPVVEKVSDVLMERHETSGDTVEGRVFDPVITAVTAAEIAPLGQGFGTEQVGGVFAESGIMNFASFEDQFPRIILETGIIGLIGYLITVVGVVSCLLEERRLSRDGAARRIVALTLFLVASFFYINVVFNHISSFFAWTVFAMTMAISRSSHIGAKRVGSILPLANVR